MVTTKSSAIQTTTQERGEILQLWLNPELLVKKTINFINHAISNVNTSSDF